MHEAERAQPVEQRPHVVARQTRVQHLFVGVAHEGRYAKCVEVTRIGHVLRQALDQRLHHRAAGRDGLQRQVGLTQHVGQQTERQRMAAAPLRGLGPVCALHTARGEQRARIGLAEVGQRVHAQQGAPLRVVAPARLGWPSTGAHGEPGLRHRRQELLAQPWLQRLDVLAAVDQQHPRIVVRSGSLEAECIDKALRSAFDRRAVDPHDAASASDRAFVQCGEQRPLADAAGAMDPQHRKRRQRRGERTLEDLQLRRAAPTKQRWAVCASRCDSEGAVIVIVTILVLAPSGGQWPFIAI